MQPAPFSLTELDIRGSEELQGGLNRMSKLEMPLRVSYLGLHFIDGGEVVVLRLTTGESGARNIAQSQEISTASQVS